MGVSQEKYTQERLEQLEEHIRIYAESGEPMDYEIQVDGIRAVKRTSNPEMFTAYENFVGPTTKSVQVSIFKGASRNCDKFMFYFREIPAEAPSKSSGSGLSGFENVEQRIQDAVNKERERWDREQLLKEKADLVKQNASLEQEIEYLEGELNKAETELDKLKAGQSPLKGALGEVGSIVVESLVRRNTHLLSAIPGGSALAGIIESDNRRIEQTALPEADKDSEVSFSIKQPSEHSEPVYCEEDQRAIGFVNSLKARFDPEEFGQVIQILNACAEDKSLIGDFIDLLTPSTHHSTTQEHTDYDETHF